VEVGLKVKEPEMESELTPTQTPLRELLKDQTAMGLSEGSINGLLGSVLGTHSGGPDDVIGQLDFWRRRRQIQENQFVLQYRVHHGMPCLDHKGIWGPAH
jgi:hypothetical protein